jgi:hypothetical protein
VKATFPNYEHIRVSGRGWAEIARTVGGRAGWELRDAELMFTEQVDTFEGRWPEPG